MLRGQAVHLFRTFIEKLFEHSDFCLDLIVAANLSYRLLRFNCNYLEILYLPAYAFLGIK